MRYEVTTKYPNPAMQRLAEWTAEMLAAAQSTAKLIGCSPAAIVAQAALESGWGRSAIGKNLFGIKVGGGWQGARQLVTTREVIGGQDIIIKDWFRDYDSYADSIFDHFAFLRDNKRYARCFDPDGSKSDREYFQALKDAGYATDPHYVSSLCGVLDAVTRFERGMTIVGDGGEPLKLRDRPLLYPGCPDSADVGALQALLQLPANGRYDNVTQAAVRKYQAANGLDPDGIVGPLTWGRLELRR